MIEIKRYEPGNIEELSRLFYQTVHSVNLSDYTEAEVDAWAPGDWDLEKRNKVFESTFTLVAFDSETIVGFGNIDDTGYLDMLFVHKDYQGMGIATEICDLLEAHVSSDITVHASITARPFFLSRGYIEVKKQKVERFGVLLINYVMVKSRHGNSSCQIG